MPAITRAAADPLPQALLSHDALPLYQHIAARLLADIRESLPRPGDRLPSERLLAERYGVSRVTLRAALGELQNRGILASEASRGWFVKDAGDTAAPTGSRVPGFADSAAAQGLTAETCVLSVQVRACTVEEAETLRIAPGAPLFDLRRLRYLDGLVVVVEHNRLPLALCPALAEVDFERSSLYATLRAADPPQIPSVADYSVEARPPSPEEQVLLEIDETIPLLVATQLAFNQDGRPLEFTVAAYRGDRYRFRASITSRP